jgi:hypothetical protein
MSSEREFMSAMDTPQPSGRQAESSGKSDEGAVADGARVCDPHWIVWLCPFVENSGRKLLSVTPPPSQTTSALGKRLPPKEINRSTKAFDKSFRREFGQTQEEAHEPTPT